MGMSNLTCTWDPAVIRWRFGDGVMGYRAYFLVDGLGTQEGDAFWLRSWIATATSKDLVQWGEATLIRFPAWKWHRKEDLRFLAPLAVASGSLAAQANGSGLPPPPPPTVSLFFSTAQASSRTEMPIIAARSEDGIHFGLSEDAAGLSPERGALHYEAGRGDTGAMRAWRDPEFLRGEDGVVLEEGIKGYRYVYFSAQVPRRKSMLATLTMCGSGGDQGDCERGWFRGTIGVARRLIAVEPGSRCIHPCKPGTI